MGRKSKMSQLVKLGVAAVLASMVTGCATVKYSSPGMLKNVSVKGAKGAEDGQLVTITTSGFYMFWAIPIVSGDLRWNERAKTIEGGTSLFQDQVSYAELQNALLKIAESRNCDLAEVYFNDSDASYAGASYSGAIGSCFGSSAMSVSAILMPRKTTAK